MSGIINIIFNRDYGPKSPIASIIMINNLGEFKDDCLAESPSPSSKDNYSISVMPVTADLDVYAFVIHITENTNPCLQIRIELII